MMPFLFPEIILKLTINGEWLTRDATDNKTKQTVGRSAHSKAPGLIMCMQ